MATRPPREVWTQKPLSPTHPRGLAGVEGIPIPSRSGSRTPHHRRTRTIPGSREQQEEDQRPHMEPNHLKKARHHKQPRRPQMLNHRPAYPRRRLQEGHDGSMPPSPNPRDFGFSPGRTGGGMRDGPRCRLQVGKRRKQRCRRRDRHRRSRVSPGLELPSQPPQLASSAGGTAVSKATGWEQHGRGATAFRSRGGGRQGVPPTTTNILHPLASRATEEGGHQHRRALLPPDRRPPSPPEAAASDAETLPGEAEQRDPRRHRPWQPRAGLPVGTSGGGEGEGAGGRGWPS